jgi:hypothetical protein
LFQQIDQLGYKNYTILPILCLKHGSPLRTFPAMAKMVFDQDVDLFWLASVIYLKSRISYYCCYYYYMDKSDLGNHVDLQEVEGIFSWMFLCLCVNFALFWFGDSGRSGEIGKYIDNVLALEGPCITPEHYYFCSRIIHEHIGVHSKLSTTGN